MNDLTRRKFLKRGSLGMAVAGALAVVPGVAAIRKLSPAPVPVLPSGMTEPLVAHVRDLESGEVALLVGVDRIVVRDRDLATRLYLAARH
jgi:hypothetical protein